MELRWLFSHHTCSSCSSWKLHELFFKHQFDGNFTSRTVMYGTNIGHNRISDFCSWPDCWVIRQIRVLPEERIFKILNLVRMDGTCCGNGINVILWHIDVSVFKFFLNDTVNRVYFHLGVSTLKVFLGNLNTKLLAYVT